MVFSLNSLCATLNDRTSFFPPPQIQNDSQVSGPTWPFLLCLNSVFLYRKHDSSESAGCQYLSSSWSDSVLSTDRTHMWVLVCVSRVNIQHIFTCATMSGIVIIVSKLKVCSIGFYSFLMHVWVHAYVLYINSVYEHKGQVWIVIRRRLCFNYSFCSWLKFDNESHLDPKCPLMLSNTQMFNLLQDRLHL